MKVSCYCDSILEPLVYIPGSTDVRGREDDTVAD